MDGRVAATVVALVLALDEEPDFLPDEDRAILEAHGRPILDAIAAHGPALVEWIRTEPTVGVMVAGPEVCEVLGGAG